MLVWVNVIVFENLLFQFKILQMCADVNEAFFMDVPMCCTAIEVLAANEKRMVELQVDSHKEPTEVG
jgi:hypothetical protein